MDLFDYQADRAAAEKRPLAERMRPRRLAELVGQDEVTGPGTLLRGAIEKDRLFSMILWGPPGCGKTTLARIVSGETRSHFLHFSAVLSGVKQIREVIEEARQMLRIHGRRTVLFVDEIHRFNKAQQDAFLHQVESGLITLIGATTENPSFEVNPALMSRCRVFTLQRLSTDALERIVADALADEERGLGRYRLSLAPEALAHLVRLADGDGRTALNHLEAVVSFLAGAGGEEPPAGRVIALAEVERALEKKALLYDKAGEEHYNLISALHKSLRGSDPDAALYWLSRMLMAGEDPLYIARRMVRFASEDVGNADPRALSLCMDAMAAFRFLGPPEGELALAQAAVYLATAPKSNRIYRAWGKVKALIDKTGALPVPPHIRNAPTALMKSLGYGKGYQYDPDTEAGVAHQTYLPDEIAGERFYEPVDRGYERTITERLQWWRRMKK
jgi:putative ATPase